MQERDEPPETDHQRRQSRPDGVSVSVPVQEVELHVVQEEHEEGAVER